MILGLKRKIRKVLERWTWRWWSTYLQQWLQWVCGWEWTITCDKQRSPHTFWRRERQQPAHLQTKRDKQWKEKDRNIHIDSLFVRKEEFERALKRATKHKEKFKRESCRNTIQKTGITLVFFVPKPQRENQIFLPQNKKNWRKWCTVSLFLCKFAYWEKHQPKPL